MTNPAVLILADGTIFEGIAIGQEGQTVGEIVFNTSTFGYQETLTDPAYAGQIVTFTYPHIGNTGVNEEDEESDRVQAAGLVIRDLPLLASNFRSTESFDNYLRRHNIIGIAEIDTRRLTRHIRDFGAQAGSIVTGANPDLAAVQQRAKAFGSLMGKELVSGVTTQNGYEWTECEWHLGERFQSRNEQPFHVVVYDFGVTRDQLRLLAERGARVTVVPANSAAIEVLALNPNGIFLSAGPGDPSVLSNITLEIQKLIDSRVPIFAVGLGHQLLAIALGGKCEKLFHGYHGANHPVQDLQSGAVMITQQNQNFTVIEDTLPKNVVVTYRSLVDGGIQGLSLSNQIAYSFQGYPSGDAKFLFDQLIDAMSAN